MSEQGEIGVRLTPDEARALLYAREIDERPTTNPLGRRGDELLAAAQHKLRAALGEHENAEPR